MSSNDIPMADADAGNPSELLVWPWTGIIATITADARRQRHEHPGLTRATALRWRPNHHAPRGGGGQGQPPLPLLAAPLWQELVWPQGRHVAHLPLRPRRGSEWQRQRVDDDGDRVFGWVAGEQDLLGSGVVGRFLRESGAKARSVEDVQKDKARHADALGAVHDEYERREKFLKAQSEEMARLLRTMEQENSWLLGELKG